MKRFGVIGHPIAHSLSPLMHRSAFSLLGLDCSYEAFDITPEALADALRDFKTQGLAGLNVTIPHKEAMLSLVDELSEEAAGAGAVNTVSFVGDRLRGDNTDVYGLSATLEPYRAGVQGKVALVLGGGGSARATTFALLTKFTPSEIIIANRSENRAKDLADHFKPVAKSTILTPSPATDESLNRSISRASLIINATPLGMSPFVERTPVGQDAPFRSDQIVFDLIYTPFETTFLALASRRGARTISGVEMFLHQGARSFEIWLGKQMPLEQIRPIILKELSSIGQIAKA